MQKAGNPLLTRYHNGFLWVHFGSFVGVIALVALYITTTYSLRGFAADMTLAWIWFMTFWCSSFFIRIKDLKRPFKGYFRLLGYLPGIPTLIITIFIPFLGLFIVFALAVAMIITPDVVYEDREYRLQKPESFMGGCCSLDVIEKGWVFEHKTGFIHYPGDISGPDIRIQRADSAGVPRFEITALTWDDRDTVFYYTVK